MLAGTLFLSISLRAAAPSQLWGRWTGTETLAKAPLLFGISHWDPKRTGVFFVFRPDGTGTFSAPASRYDSSEKGAFLYSLKRDTLHLQTVRVFDANAKAREPAIDVKLPPEVYRVKINNGVLVMEKPGQQARFVLRRVMKKPHRERL